MSIKQIVIVFIAVVIGGLASAAAIRYVEPVGQLVLTAPTGVPLLDEHRAFKPTSTPAEMETVAAHTKREEHKGHDDEKRGEHADHGHKDDDHKDHADHKAGDHKDDGHKDHADHKDDHKSHADHKDGDHKGHEGHKNDDHKDHSDHKDDHKSHGDHKDDDHKDHGHPKKSSDHEGHDDHGEERVVKLAEAEQREFGIEVGMANSGELQQHVTLPGEVALNADRRAHVVPRVSGVVQAVHKTLGDQVQVGDVLAVLDSRELADLKSAYLTAAAQAGLAQSTFNRENRLLKQKITSEQDYLQAKQDLAAAKIAKRAAAQKLRALGFSDTDIANFPKQSSQVFTHYAITAPFNGTIIERHISLGEVLQDDAAAFVVADLSTVWVDLRVYPKDLPFVRVGQAAVISAGRGIPDATRPIAYVGPVVGEQTRTALARVVLPNPDGRWRPGLFVTASVDVETSKVSFLVPKTALQTVEDQPAVFIQTAEGFVPQPVTLGRKNDAYIEVTSGLTPGQRYVTRGAFTLKAQLAKGSFGDGHNH